MLRNNSSYPQVDKSNSNHAWANRSSATNTPKSGSKVSCCGKKPSTSSKVKFGEVIAKAEEKLSDEDFDYDDVSGISDKSSLSKKTCACSTQRAHRRNKILNFLSLVMEVSLMGLKKFPAACAQVVSGAYAGSFQRPGNMNYTLDISNKLAFCSLMNVLDMVSHLLLIIFRLAILVVDSFMLLVHIVTGLYCDSRNWWKKRTARRYDVPLRDGRNGNSRTSLRNSDVIRPRI